MAVDKNALEQRALTFLSRGQVERAIGAYITILKADPRDRRIRQKLAEAYVKVNRRQDAERQLRQLARAYAHDGNHRATISVLMRLRELAPKDLELVGQLADAHYAAGNRMDALPLYREAWEATWRTDIVRALHFGDRVIALDPGDVQFQVDMAEAATTLNMRDKAYELYMRVIGEFRRKGLSEDVGRIAIRALELRPDDPSLLRAAAEAALDVDDMETALRHLEPALERSPSDPDILELVARCYERAQETAPAITHLLKLAEACQAAGLAERWLDALERAHALGATGLERRMAKATAAAARARFRLWGLDEAVPETERALRICVRAEVLLRYGFRKRAHEELREGLFRDRSVAVLAWAVEVMLAEGNKDDGLRYAQELLDALEGGSKRLAARRIHALGGPAPEEDEDEDDAPAANAAAGTVDDEDDELIDDELIDDEDDELIDDEETAPPDTSAPGAEQEDSELDPFGADSDPFDDVFQSGGTFAEVDPDQLPAEDPLDDPFEEAPAEPEPPAPAVADVSEAASMVGMGLFAEAAQALRGVEGLRAAALRSICQRELSTPQAAFDELRDHIDEADETDDGYPDALFELAELAARAGKQKLALRTLRDLQELAPDFRHAEVRTRIKLLKRLLG